MKYYNAIQLLTCLPMNIMWYLLVESNIDPDTLDALTLNILIGFIVCDVY